MKQLCVRLKTEIRGGREVEAREENKSEQKQFPSLRDGEIGKHENGSQLDRYREGHHQRGYGIFFFSREIKRSEEQKDGQQMRVRVVEDHHEVPGGRKSGNRPHGFWCMSSQPSQNNHAPDDLQN